MILSYNCVMDEMRLNKYLALHGVGSRREVNEMIKQGRVKVNNSIAQLNHRVKSTDIILVDEKTIEGDKELAYIIINKPKGVISTTSDEFGRKAVTDLVKSKQRIFPVGRLDATTIGLLLLTNDGDLTYKLTHPKFGIEKTYQMTVTGEVDNNVLDKLENGVYLKEGMTSKATVKVLRKEGNRTILELSIHQGWNHQIKRMCAVLRLNLINLKRTSIGPIKLGELKPGEYRDLTEGEVLELKNS